MTLQPARRLLASPAFLRSLLFFLLLYVVNDLHFKPLAIGVRGLAPINLLFLLACLAVRAGAPDAITIEAPILKKPLFYFFGVLGFAFLWAQVRAFGGILSDLTFLKNACFYPLFYFLFLHCKQDLKWTRLMVLWIMVIASVAGLEAIKEGIDYGVRGYSPFKRAAGPFGEDWQFANEAGVFFGMFLPMLTAVALFTRGWKIPRLGAVAGMILISAGTIFTYSRQSYLICLLSTAVLLVRRSVVAAAVIGVALIALASVLPSTVTERLEETKDTVVSLLPRDERGAREVDEGTTGRWDMEIDEGTANRWEIWAGALQMAWSHPIGVGLERFKREIGNYTSHEGMDAHDFYLRTLAEYGPQGLIALSVLLHAMYKLTKFMRQSVPKDHHEARAFAIGFTLTTLCTALGNVYGSRFLEGTIMGCYWALAGLLERYFLLLRAETAAVDARAPEVTEESAPSSRPTPTACLP